MSLDLNPTIHGFSGNFHRVECQNDWLLPELSSLGALHGPLQGVTSPSLWGLRTAPRLEGVGLKGSDVIQLWASFLFALLIAFKAQFRSLELTSRPKNKKINEKINMIFFQFFLGNQCVFLTISSWKISKLPYKLSAFATISLSAASSSAICHN